MSRSASQFGLLSTSLMKMTVFVSAAIFAVVTMPGRASPKKYNEFELKDLRQLRQDRKDDKARRLEDEQEEQQEAHDKEKLARHHGDDDLDDDDASGDLGSWRRGKSSIPEPSDDDMSTEPGTDSEGDD